MIISQLISKVGLDTGDVQTGLQSFSQAMVSGVGTATQQAQLRIDALSDRIGFQKRQLDILGQGLTQASRQYGENSVQVQRAQLSYDRLANSIEQSEKRLPALRSQLDSAGNSAARAATAGEQFSASFKNGLVGIVGPAALAMGAISGLQRAISGTIEAGGEALALREQQNALRAVTGDLAGYTEALDTARAQQRLFGGSLRENIEGIQGLAITAKETGADLDKLVDLTQRLVLKSPEQGAGGARIGLVESLSEGNIRSLSRRFEIPTAALKDLADESLSTEERLKSLDDYLNRIGITSEAAAGRVDESALAYRRLNQEWQDLALKGGGQLADTFAGIATGLARMVGVINGNPKALAEIQAILAGRTGITEGDIEHSAQLLRTDKVMGAESGARDSAFARDKLTGVESNTAALDVAKNRLILLGASSDAMRDKVVDLYAAFGHTGDIRAFEKGLRDLEGAANHGTKAIGDTARATKELTDDERDRLETQRGQTYDRAGDAFAKLKTAETDYQRERGDRLSEHQRKLADIQSDGAGRLAEIDERYQQQRTDADRSYLDKRADIAHDLTRKLTDLEQDFAGDQARMRTEAAERLAGIDSGLSERLIDLRRVSAERIAELEAQSGEQAEARRDAAAERARASSERRAELEQQLSQRLADFDQQQLERRITAQESYQEKLSSLSERHADQEVQAGRAAADRAQAEQDRLFDMAEAAADRTEDRAQRHADRLADIQRKAEGGGQGRITRLTGETFTTEDIAGGGGNSDTARLLAEEEARFRVEEDRAARDEQRARDKLARDRQRQEEAATERLAEAEQSYQDELSAADAAYASQAAKADEKAARDRARLEEAVASQIAALETQTARADEMAAKQEAKEDEKRQRQIDKERESLAAREADAIADSDKQRARITTELESDLETRNAAFEQARADATAHAGEQLADAEAAYVAQLTKLQEAHANQRSEAEAATAERIAAEADSFARQDEQRASAYARQLDTLKTALGEQLSEYTRVQLELGDITQEQADRRQKIIEDQYGAQAKAQAEAFDAFFSGEFGHGSKETPDRQPAPGAPLDLRDQLQDGTANRGGIMIANLTVNGVQDARSFLVELRRLVVNDVRANGGDADAYWGGS